MKRGFEGFQVPQQRLSRDPGREYADPKPFQAPAFDEYDLVTGDATGAASGTDFSDWTEAELRSFLDQRGEDFDDCPDAAALVQRAQQCEANTGPAVRPAHGGTAAAAPGGEGAAAEEEEDPLDAFMAEMHAMEAASTAAAAPAAATGPLGKKARHSGAERLDEEDHVADFLARRQGGATAGASGTAAAAAAGGGGCDSDEEVYAAAAALDAAAGRPDEDADTAAAMGKREIESLTALDHSQQSYEEITKDFYEEVPELAALTPVQVADRRRALGVKVSGFKVPGPVDTFAQCGFDAPLAQAIQKAGYLAPTPIQAQALPTALAGRDILGIAKTGSGKTAAFVLPMVMHVLDQREVQKGEGPVAVVVAPTRELAEQIHREARRFGRPYQLRVCAAFGGLSKAAQVKELRAGVDAAVCTPGRMIDLIKTKACTTRRVTYLVFDEADRMFDLGFEPQVRSLLGQVRPDRQTLLFSATMPRRVERLAADALNSPVRVVVGEAGAANEDVTQTVHMLPSAAAKLAWLRERLPGMIDEGDVLVFANQKARVEEVAAAAEAAGARAAALHGDMDQATRMEVLSGFKSGTFHVLVATDVAARGLDIASIKWVVNFDAAKDIDTHVHRVGRTGRAGDKTGVAHTLLLPHEVRQAADLVQCLITAGQEVLQEVHDLAMRDGCFQRGGRGGGRGRRGGGRRGPGGKRPAVGGLGLGFELTGAAGGAGIHATDLAGFARSHDQADAHFSAATAPAAAPAPAAPSPSIAGASWGNLPPPPPVLPAQASALSPAAAAAAAAVAPPWGNLPPPPPVPSAAVASTTAASAAAAAVPPWGTLPPPPPLPAAALQPLPPPPGPPPGMAPPSVLAAAAAAADATSPAAGPPPSGHQQDDWAAARQARQALAQQQFKSSFVSSGTRQGDAGAKAQIVMPKAARQAPAAVVAPPVPVTQVPLYLRQRGGPPVVPGGTAAAAAQSQQLGGMQSEAVQRAIAQAQAVAARLAAQAPGGGGQAASGQWRWSSGGR